jgi:hypothetical protein
LRAVGLTGVETYGSIDASDPASVPAEGGGWQSEPKGDGFRYPAFKESGSLPFRPSLGCEARDDHFTGDRIRRGTTFLRRRPDQSPEARPREQLGRTDPPKPFPEVFRKKESVT